MYTGETFSQRPPLLKHVSDRINSGQQLSADDIRALLSITDPLSRDELFALARKVRHNHFGNKIFLYGFLYFSTHCRNNCQFCEYRRTNTELSRYRKSSGEIIDAAVELANSGVHLIDLTMGEDPELYNNKDKFEELLQTITEVQEKTDLPVMVSPGVVSFEAISGFAERNVSWFACYQETHDQDHFNRLRKGQDYQQRINVKVQAKKSGILIEEGILLGTGETIENITDSILWMRDNEVDQVRAMTYIAPENSPLPAMPQNMVEEQIVLAVMRLAMPERLIPASLDIDGLDGLASRLDAGANVITSIVPPDQGLAGVANRSLDIEEQRRSVVQIQPVLDLCNLVPATALEYKSLIAYGYA